MVGVPCSVLEVRRESVAEVPEGEPHVVLDGLGREVERRGDLGVGQAVLAVEEEDLAATGGQVRDRVVDRPLEVAAAGWRPPTVPTPRQLARGRPTDALSSASRRRRWLSATLRVAAYR